MVVGVALRFPCSQYCSRLAVPCAWALYMGLQACKVAAAHVAWSHAQKFEHANAACYTLFDACKANKSEPSCDASCLIGRDAYVPLPVPVHAGPDSRQHHALVRPSPPRLQVRQGVHRRRWPLLHRIVRRMRWHARVDRTSTWAHSASNTQRCGLRHSTEDAGSALSPPFRLAEAFCLPPPCAKSQVGQVQTWVEAQNCGALPQCSANVQCNYGYPATTIVAMVLVTLSAFGLCVFGAYVAGADRTRLPVCLDLGPRRVLWLGTRVTHALNVWHARARAGFRFCGTVARMPARMVATTCSSPTPTTSTTMTCDRPNSMSGRIMASRYPAAVAVDASGLWLGSPVEALVARARHGPL